MSPRKLWHKGMLWLRRIHLYSGLFMLPWVLLYGFTGWFFNHPRYFTADEHHRIATKQAPTMPAAEATAARIVEELNIESLLVDGPAVELAAEPNPEYTAYLVFTARGEKQSHTITLHPITGEGEIHTVDLAPLKATEETAADQPTNLLADIPSVEVAETAQNAAAEAIPGMLEKLGLESAEANPGRRSSSLRFAAIVDGKPCRVTYNLRSRAVSARPEVGAPVSSTTTKSFLQRLHMARGYTPHLGTRTWWAISVDAMFASMVFWGLSGVLMWWQIKRTRLLGSAVLMASLISASMLAIGMHDELSSSGRGRGGGGNRGSHTAATPTPAPNPTPSPAMRTAVQNPN